MTEPLWQRALSRVARQLVGGHPTDEACLVELYIELYAVGERPSPQELTAFLRQRWPAQDKGDRERAVELWRRVLEKPSRNFRCIVGGPAWARPYLILDQICDEDGVESVGGRLVRQVELNARSFCADIERPFELETVEAAAMRLESSVLALLIWGAANDHDDKRPLPAHVLRPRGISRNICERTRQGRMRQEARLERAREKYERELPRWGEPT